MKILLPLDIVNPTAPIIEQLEALLPLRDKEVHLLYVNEAWPAYENMIASWGKFADDWTKKVEEKASATLAQAEAVLETKCASVTKEIVSGPPAMMIETVARAEHCDITVVAPGKHPTVEQLLLGSVSGKVVKHCPGTILICRQEKAPTQIKNILIGVDGSRNSQEAMMNAVKTFGLNTRNVNVLLFHAVDVADPVKYVSPVEFISKLEQNLLMQGETFLAEAKRMLSEAGVKNIEIALKEGKPSLEIIAVAKAMPADLIIAGAEGRTAIQHFLLGSVSQHIAMHSPCAVAIVKRKHT